MSSTKKHWTRESEARDVERDAMDLEGEEEKVYE